MFFSGENIVYLLFGDLLSYFRRCNSAMSITSESYSQPPGSLTSYPFQLTFSAGTRAN